MNDDKCCNNAALVVATCSVALSAVRKLFDIASQLTLQESLRVLALNNDHIKAGRINKKTMHVKDSTPLELQRHCANYRRAHVAAKDQREIPVEFSAEDKKRLAWHSRRGMLELDLLLVPFAEQKLASLESDQLRKYQLLLSQEDQDLFVWLTRRELAPTPELQDIIMLILNSRTSE